MNMYEKGRACCKSGEIPPDTDNEAFWQGYTYESGWQACLDADDPAIIGCSASHYMAGYQDAYREEFGDE